jgi:hypothetical protein
MATRWSLRERSESWMVGWEAERYPLIADRWRLIATL